MKILIADDETSVGKGLVRLLRNLPGVLVVNHRTEMSDAIHALLDLQPDLLILDHHFPNGTGEEVARKVRQYSPGTRVILFSAHMTSQDRLRYEQVGVTRFFEKTTGIDDLLTEVQALVH